LNFLPAAECGSIFLALRQDGIHGLVNCGSLLRQPKRTFHYGLQLRVNRADKNNGKGLGLTNNSSSISAILASLFGLEFSLQIYIEVTGFSKHYRIVDGG
jgi:hypothetical protein